MREAGEFVSPFQQADALLEHVSCRVHKPGVNIPKLFKGEEVSGVLGIVESESSAFVDRYRARMGLGIGLMSTVEAKCFVFHAEKALARILEMGNTAVEF